MRDAPRLQWNEVWLTILSYSIVSVMMGCMIVVAAQFLESSGIPVPASLPILGILFAWEAFLTYRVSRSKPLFSSVWWLARGVELVVLCAVIKLVLELQFGFNVFVHDLAIWPQNFGAGYFNREYLGVLFSLLVVWVMSTLFANDLDVLEVGELSNLLNQQRPGGYEPKAAVETLYRKIVDSETLPSDRRANYRRIFTRTLVIGLIMAILAGFMNISQVSFFQGQNLSQTGVLSLLLYFLLALWLFSLANYLAMRAAWGYEHTSIHAQLDSHWAVYSLVFLLVIGALAVIIPAGYSLGLISTANYALGLIKIIVEFLIGLIVLPFVLIFQLFGYLSGSGSENTGQVETPVVSPTQVPLPATSTVQTAIPWWNVLRSFVFWGIFIAVLGFALYQYIRQNQVLIAAFRKLPVGQWTRRTWRWLRRLFASTRVTVATSLQAGWAKIRSLRQGSPPGLRWRYINPSRLPPRQRIQFYYLALLRRGQDAGYPREPSQTPYGYARVLESDLLDQAGDVVDITENFLEARYSSHEMSIEQASRVKQAWERVRGALKSISRKIE